MKDLFPLGKDSLATLLLPLLASSQVNGVLPAWEPDVELVIVFHSCFGEPENY